jgi:UDP-N-acetyl-D-mannosaminuronic acid dehydrogenase
VGSQPRRADVCIVGGAGRVGFPLALVLASKGQQVLIHDLDARTVALISQGKMPFLEDGAEGLLRAALAKGLLSFSSKPETSLAGIPTLVVTIGTPVDEFLNPTLKGMAQLFQPLLPSLSDGQLVILRSTVYPGTTEWLDRHVRSAGRHPKIAFCPERVVEGHAIEELQRLPQIVSGMTADAEDAAAAFFLQMAPQVVRLKPLEAEFAKLFCNAYRYIQFAATNQLYMIANAAGLDYYRILDGMKRDYPRMRDLPGAGLSAGPCLFKDTVQLNAFYSNSFSMGNAAMFVNEGLPLYIVNQLAKAHDLARLTVGLLGMAFKADSDDPRASLSYKLKKLLRFHAKEVLTTDPCVREDKALLPLDEVLARSDLLILCIPHQAYRGLDVHGKPVVDIWNFFGKGGQI